jgi:hypothetical protein
MKHPLLDKIELELSGVNVTHPVEIGGHKYGMATLDGGEESLARSLVTVTDDTPMWHALTDTTVPTLAVALRSIDDTPIEAIFKLADNASDDDRVSATSDEKRWRCKQVMGWIAGRPNTFVKAMMTGYAQIQQDSQKALGDLKDLSKRTPSGA